MKCMIHFTHDERYECKSDVNEIHNCCDSDCDCSAVRMITMQMFHRCSFADKHDGLICLLRPRALIGRTRLVSDCQLGGGNNEEDGRSEHWALSSEHWTLNINEEDGWSAPNHWLRTGGDLIVNSRTHRYGMRCTPSNIEHWTLNIGQMLSQLVA